MDIHTKEKKERVTINIDEKNLLFLKWLKINYGDGFSLTANTLITKYRNEVTKDMTPFEIEQIECLKVVDDRGAIDVKKIRNLRTSIMMGEIEETLKDKAKRDALKNLLNLYENE